MPSPFPGMDPYLEGNWWTSFHALFASQIATQLNRVLRPKYVARPERKYITGSLPEVTISTKMIRDVSIKRTANRKLGATSTMTIAPSVKMRTRLATKVPHFRIEIRDAGAGRLVTAIELLSPTNKGSGRKRYLHKRLRFLHSKVHLLEIDLHHQGQRIPLDDPYPPGAYYVLLNRARKRSVTDLWPIALDQELPVVPVPLLKGDTDVGLDLQKAFADVYEAGAFDVDMDYRKPPDVALPADEAEWLVEHLRKKGLRR